MPELILMESTGTGVSVTSALSTATEMFEWVLDIVTGNTILCAAFVLSVLVPAGVMVFHKLKNTV